MIEFVLGALAGATIATVSLALMVMEDEYDGNRR